MPPDDFLAAETAIEPAILLALHPLTEPLESLTTMLRGSARRALEVEGQSPWVRAQGLLFGRVAEDIRCSIILAGRGYPLQAATVAASAFENGYTAAAIGLSDEAATEWLDWQSLNRVPWRLKNDYLRRGLKNWLNRDDEATTRSRASMYHTLCLAKHGNPNAQKHFRPRIDPLGYYLRTHPDLADGPHDVSILALFLAFEGGLAALLATKLRLCHDAAGAVPIVNAIVQAYNSLGRVVYR